MKSALIAIPVVIIVLWIAANFLWNRKWRPWRQSKGVAVPTFNDAMRRVVRFVIREDAQPFPKFPKIKLLNRKTVYLAIFAAGIAANVAQADILLRIAPFAVLILTIMMRVHTVFTARNAILTRMFQVAHSEFKYPRGAELNPWGYVNIKQWDSLTVPGETVVSYPAAWRSDDPQKRSTFENHFNSTVTDENTWIYEWNTAQGTVLCTPVTHVPEMAAYEGSEKSKWNEIPMGLGASGQVFWDVTSAPHILICGTTGGGKSVTQRTIIFHCIQHSDRWRFLGVDLKRVELSAYKKYDDVVLGVATNLEDGVEVMRFGRDEMMSRYEQMEAVGVDHFMKLADPPFALLIMVDEAYMFMSPEGVKTDEGKARDELHGEATTLIGEIARLGRAAGVHLVIATQRPDAKVIYGEIKENLAARYAAGKMKSTASLMVLDSDGATRVPGNIKGRAILSINGDETMLQGYFAEQKWIDEWLASKGRSIGASSNTMNSSFEGSNEDDFPDPRMLVALPEDFEDGDIEQRFTPEPTSPQTAPLPAEFLDDEPTFDPFGVDKTVMPAAPSVPAAPMPQGGLPRPTRTEGSLPAPAPRPQAAAGGLPRPGGALPAPRPAQSLQKPPVAPPVQPAPTSNDNELVNPFDMSRPKLGGGASRQERAEDGWDDGMDSIFADLPQNTPQMPARPTKPQR